MEVPLGGLVGSGGGDDGLVAVAVVDESSVGVGVLFCLVVGGDVLSLVARRMRTLAVR